MQSILICALAAAGVLLFCWSILGWLLLPAFGANASFVLRYHADAPSLEQDLRAWQWMQGSGILRGRLLVLDDGMSPAARLRAERLLAQTKNAQLCNHAEFYRWTETESL